MATGVFSGTALSSSATRAPERGTANSAVDQQRLVAATLELTTVGQINQYLRSISVDPKGVVIQRGTKNYAGPNCPGTAWNCTSASKVVQLASSTDAAAVNRFVCRRDRGTGTADPANTPPEQSCVIVQPGGASNSATCDMDTSSAAGLISQTCLITQSGASNTAVAKLLATLTGPGTEQDIRQRIEIKQTGGTSGNTLRATQNARLRMNFGSGGALAAKQDFNQVICANQQAAGSGSNTATVTQKGDSLTQARNRGDVGILQNTEERASTCLPTGPAAPFADFSGTGHDPTLCPIAGESSGAPKVNANICSRVQQDAVNGKNRIVQDQHSLVDAQIDRVAQVDLEQGTVQGGVDSTQDQRSTALSTIADTQRSEQLSSVAQATGTINMKQIEDPRCCAGGHQLGNSGNTWKLRQNLRQRAFVNKVLVDPESFEGGEVEQFGANYGNCTTSGTPPAGCTIEQELTNNSGTETNSCGPASSCDVFIACANAVCTTEDNVDVTLSNTATVSSTTPDPNAENNSDTETTLVQGNSAPEPFFSRAAVEAITPTSTASDLANAIANDTGAVTGASFQAVPPNGTPNAVADSGTALGGFPTAGTTYAILTSGDANFADDPNSSGSTTADLLGPNVRGDTDLDVTILKIDLSVPSTRNCLTFDFRFLSEEFPEFVGSSFNDAFIAELDTSDWTTSGSTITAPNNFAFDSSGNVISINAAGAATMTAAEAAGTTYDGATPLLSASTPITAGAHSLYLSIFDQGDRNLDSAVFVDNLFLGTTAAGACQAGATVLSAAKTADDVSTAAGGSNGYTITISNPSDTAATVTSIFDVLPAGFSYTAGSTTGVTTANPSIDGQTLTWSGPFNVPADGSISLHFGVTVSTTPGEYFNEAGGSATGGSVSPTGPTAPVTVTEGAPDSADLSVDKTDSPDPVVEGEELTYTITVSNAGPNAAQDVTLTDVLPESVTFDSASASQGSCEGTTTVTCDLGTIAADGSATVTITVIP